MKEAKSELWGLDLGLINQAFYAALLYVTSRVRGERTDWMLGKTEERREGRSSLVGWGNPSLASQACHSCA